MAVRLVITFTAAPGRGADLATAFKARCAEVVQQEHGCEQYESFQSVANPDRLILMELWTEQADLDAHAEVNKARPPLPRDLFAGSTEREDYVYNKTR